MQGQLSYQWLDTLEQNKKAKEDEHEQVMPAIWEEKKKVNLAREATEKKVGDLENLVDKPREENSQLWGTVGAQDGEIKELKEAQSSQKQKLRELEGKIDKGEDAALGAFLKSHAYRTAAYATASVEMRWILYGVVDALTDHWPLKAEEFGIMEVPDEENPPDLSGYQWDRLNDRQISPDGEILEAPLICPDPSTFLTVKPMHPWPKKYYPYEDDDNELAEALAVGEKAAKSSGSKKRQRSH